MTQAIFWDNDGILVETEPLYLEATRETLATAGIPLTDDQYVELFLVQGRGAWHLAEARGIPPDEVQRLREARNALYARRLAEAPRVMPGVTAVLASLHGRYPMGVVTSSRRDHFELIHERTGLLPYFDFVLTADEVPRTKPHPDLYLRAVDRSGVDRTECVAIEDSARGLAAATAAGVPCIVVPTALTRRSAFPGALRVLDRIEELLTLL